MICNNTITGKGFLLLSVSNGRVKNFFGLAVLVTILFVHNNVQGQGTITGKSTAGAGTNTTYTLTDDVIYTNANWQATNGIVVSSSQSGLTYTATIRFTGPAGTETVSFLNGTTVIATKSVTVNCGTIAIPPASLSYAYNCGSTTITASGTPVAGTSWYWQTSTTGTDMVNWSGTPFVVTTPGTYYLRAVNDNASGCWGPELATIPVTISTPPTASASSQSICSGQTTSILISNPNNVSGTTFSWTVASGTNTTGATSGSGSTIAQTLTSTDGTSQGTVTYTITPTAGTCSGTPINVTATVKPKPQLSNLPSSISICSGTALNFTPTANIGGSTFAWTSSIGGTISAGSVSASGSGAITNSPVNTGNTNGTVTYSVTPSLNSCTGTVQNYTVTVKSIPTVAISANQTICSGLPAPFTISNPNGVSGTTFSWTQSSSNVTGASNGTGASISQTLTSTNGTTQGTVTYIATATANSCNSLTASATATVKPKPQITNSAAQLAVESCSTTALNFTPSSSIAGTTYAWTSSATAGITGHSGSGSGTITNTLTNALPTPGTVTYVITPALNGCSGTIKNYVVTVVPKPGIAITGFPALVYGSTTNLSTNATAAQYSWKLNGTNISGATASTYRAVAIGTYTVGIKNTVSSTLECVSGGTIININTASQAAPVNYVSTTRILKSGIVATASLYGLNPEDLAQTIAYQDGIGRTFQTIGVGLSSQQTDLINPIFYGKQGFGDTTFLPYSSSFKDGRFQLNAIRTAGNNYVGSDQHNFYQNEAMVAHEANPFARTIIRQSPDGRVTEQGAPGTDWQPTAGHTVKQLITINTATYPVRYWKADGTTSGNYPAKSVVVAIMTDENGNKVQTYTNSLGQTVLKQVQLDEVIVTGPVVNWLETYYVYDVYGRLIYQLPPKAMSVLGTGTSLDANNSSVAELMYKYIYDSKGRLVEKKVPGAAWEYIVYDKFDRVVLTQDGNLRVTNDWMFVKYDYLNRPVFSGLYKNTVQTTRSTVQSYIDTNYSGRFEIEQNNTAFHGYSNTTFPITNSSGSPLTLLSVNYYDHYNFDRALASDYKYDSLHLSGIPNATYKNIRGLPAGTKKAIIDATGAVTGWLISAVFYDQYERPVQTQSNNHLNPTAQDKSSVVYDFVRATKSKTTHAGPTTVNITRRYTFDPSGRMVGVYQTIDALPEQQVAAFTYNKLGQLVDKKLHNTGGTNFLQSIDYRYNIRGWLTSINNSQLTNDGVMNDDTNDIFGMQLNYNSVDAGIGNTAFYNGNISAVTWKGPGLAVSASDNQRNYKYTYDKSDKLKAATFQAHNGTSWTKEANTLNESMAYDHNGNILSLTRNQNLRGLSGVTVTSTPQTIDNLTYTYTTNQNQLNMVEDAGLIDGFKNGTINGTNEYTYSANGSLISDNNKGISTIAYNSLGKPRQINFTDGRVVAYTYAADGSKLKMAVTFSGVTTTTDYVGGFVYTNNGLNFFGSSEGRVVKNGSAYEYQYAIGDHQGNTRVVFSSVAPAPYAPIATWEGNAGDNASQYSNVVAGNVVSFTAANHTPAGTQALRMNQTNKIQATKSVAVYPGDKIDLEVWEYHEGTTGFGTTSTPIATLITNVAGAFGGVSGAPDVSGSIYNGVNSAITGFGAGGNQGNARPAAYLNYILFDKNYKVLNAGWQLAPATTFTKQKLSFATIDVKEAGFVFVWLSYDDDSNNWAYFDDLKVTHTKNNIIQYNEYYPFGLQTASSWTRENNTSNNYLANGGTELNTTSGVYDLDYRNYDPVLGRMNQLDPMAAKYSSVTPYNFSFNDPVAFTDPNGADPSPGEPDFRRRDIGPLYLGRAVFHSGFNVAGRGTPAAFFNPGWGVASLSLSYASVGGMNLAQFDQISEDAVNLTPQEYGEKYGEVDGIESLSFNVDGHLFAGQIHLLGANAVSLFYAEAVAVDGGLGQVGNPIVIDFEGGGNAAESFDLFYDGLVNSDKSDFFTGSNFIGISGFTLMAADAGNKGITAGGQAKYMSRFTYLREIANTSKNISKIAKGAGYFGAAITLVEVAKDGSVSAGDVTRLALATTSAVFPAFGLVLGGADIIMYMTTGTTLTDRIANGVDSALPGKLEF